MKLTWLIVLALLTGAGRAEAKCRLPEIELIWSYPSAGAVDVPTNAELWVVVPYPWGTPSMRLNGQVVVDESAPDSRTGRGVVHLVPGPLESNQDYVLRLDFTGIRQGEDAGANAVMELAFRTGATQVERLPAPMLGAHQVMSFDGFETVGGACPDVLLAQDCRDTGPNSVHSFAQKGVQPLGWLVGDDLLPARCGAPQVLRHSYRTARECLLVRAIGPGGLLSAETEACIDTAASSSSQGDDHGCNLATGSAGWPLVTLALLRCRRKKSCA